MKRNRGLIVFREALAYLQVEDPSSRSIVTFTPGGFRLCSSDVAGGCHAAALLGLLEKLFVINPETRPSLYTASYLGSGFVMYKPREAGCGGKNCGCVISNRTRQLESGVEKGWESGAPRKA